ncbi:hypothetical protein NPIL_130571 [Nephila pilipes]|uniref:Uncharacterized protein n=1 Tax=Nephila pilipes TaxID=299642 RepID=A0A8X6PT43_NEPPI|nr:hypothetical protein NPIL_130571 [Nephila pilipes]
MPTNRDARPNQKRQSKVNLDPDSLYTLEMITALTNNYKKILDLLQSLVKLFRIQPDLLTDLPKIKATKNSDHENITKEALSDCP